MGGAKRVRLDVLLVERGYFPTRAKAQAAIMAGAVRVDGEPALKAGTPTDPGARIEIVTAQPYVSRGGLKLEHALRAFGIAVAGKTCLDVGASTGGFTDCLLQRGARRVYAIDVGYGQLDWKLRNDPRVVVVERTNFRYAQPGDFPTAELIAVDVSFISLSKILPAARHFLDDSGDLVALVKPQFEAGPEAVGKGGVVRDPLVHRRVLLTLIEAAGEGGWDSLGLEPSPIKGAEGNIEYLIWLRLGGTKRLGETAVAKAVVQAHERLGTSQERR